MKKQRRTYQIRLLILILLFGLMFHPTTVSAAAKSKQWIKKVLIVTIMIRMERK